MLIVAAHIALLLAFLTIQHLVVRFIARRDGFKPVTYNLNEFGPVLFTCRWRSVRIGKSRWGRNVTITLFRDYIHLKLMGFFGGGEILLSLHDADYSFSPWIHGDIVDITIDRKTYTFGAKICNQVKQYYC